MTDTDQRRPDETYDQWASRRAQELVENARSVEATAEQRSEPSAERRAVIELDKRAYESHDEWVARITRVRAAMAGYVDIDLPPVPERLSGTDWTPIQSEPGGQIRAQAEQQAEWARRRQASETPVLPPPGGYRPVTAEQPSISDLPERVVVGANGAYWRDYGSFYSMCPVSPDNDPVVPFAVYVPEVRAEQPSHGPTDPTGEQTWAAARQKEGSMNEMREMTPQEIRRDEIAQVLDFVQGDPIDGAPSKKAIIAGIKSRLNELTPPSIEEEPTPPNPEPEAPGLDFYAISGLVAQIEEITAKIKNGRVADDKRNAILLGLDLLKLDEDKGPADRLVAEQWRTSLATSIAVALSGFLTAD